MFLDQFRGEDPFKHITIWESYVLFNEARSLSCLSAVCLEGLPRLPKMPQRGAPLALFNSEGQRKFNKSVHSATSKPDFGLTADKEAWNVENNNWTGEIG